MKTGQRVRLKPNTDEGWPEEFGVILGEEENGTYMVEVDRRYRTGKFDDGLREVLSEDIEAV